MIFKVPLTLYFEASDSQIAAAMGEVYAYRITELLKEDNSRWVEDNVVRATTSGAVAEVDPEDLPTAVYDRQKIIDNVGEEMGLRLLRPRG